jgi:hypothetical protein
VRYFMAGPPSQEISKVTSTVRPPVQGLAALERAHRDRAGKNKYMTGTANLKEDGGRDI